jgi:hypothetical protein
MDTNDTNPVDISDNLEDFSNDFFETKEKAPEVQEDTDDDTVATDDDTDASAQTEDEAAPDEEADTTDDDSDEDEEPEEKPKGKQKKSAQARINEITKRAYEAERQNAALIQRLEALETRERSNSRQEPIQEQLPQGAPQPDAVNEKGELLYPLGEFDSNYITALTKYSIEQEKINMRQEMIREAEAQRLAEAQHELQTSWAERLDETEAEIPEIREHIGELVDTFAQIPPQYGEYLATTIMQCENGPQIMEYLSQNIDEAQQIVASGPMAATLAIGKLEAKLSKPTAKSNNKVVSKAPRPPEQVNKGRKGGTVSIREDTDDLASFERLFYNK